MFKISKIEHRTETRIKLAFPYDAAIIEKVKKLDSARYSASMKSWHIPYTKEAFNNFKTLNIPYTTLPNSGTTGTSIKYIQELLGHKDIKTTMIYTHISNIEIGRIKSPIDRMNLKKPNFGKK